MASCTFFITGSGNGLVPLGTKPLPDPILIYQQIHTQKHCNNILFNIQRFPFKAISFSPQWVNTLGPRQNGQHLPDEIFNCIFLNEKVWISIKISLRFVPKGPIDNIPPLVQIMSWRLAADKSLSEPTLVYLLKHICFTWPQRVNTMYPMTLPLNQSRFFYFRQLFHTTLY